MGLNPLETRAVVDELNASLLGAVVQKVHLPNYATAVLELRHARQSIWLWLDVGTGAEGISAALVKPVFESSVPAQTLWRSLFKEARLIEAASGEVGHAARLAFQTPKHTWTVHLAFGPPAFLALVNDKQRVVAVLSAAPSRCPVRAGDAWQLSAAFAPLPAAVLPVRLALDAKEPWPVLQAAHRLLRGVNQRRSLQSATAPWRKKLDRLERTAAKVRSEASREEAAMQHWRDGELIKKAAHTIPRGATTVTLTEYWPDGQMAERTVSLDPKRAPKDLAEWHFHQYRRLLRGVAMAKERLKALEAERQLLLAKMAEVEGQTLERTSIPTAPKPKSRQPRAGPYREYHGTGGQVIWVGKGPAANDELTLHLAKPYHVWLHVRGRGGAHVVVPLPKGVELSAELLIDAAHLALHHSSAKGEDRAEVSYTLAKYVRKPKGAPPGAVTMTHEKTFWLVVDAVRLQKLLATAR